jgi:hypothetical protein
MAGDTQGHVEHFHFDFVPTSLQLRREKKRKEKGIPGRKWDNSVDGCIQHMTSALCYLILWKNGQVMGTVKTITAEDIKVNRPPTRL